MKRDYIIRASFFITAENEDDASDIVARHIRSAVLYTGDKYARQFRNDKELAVEFTAVERDMSDSRWKDV